MVFLLSLVIRFDIFKSFSKVQNTTFGRAPQHKNAGTVDQNWRYSSNTANIAG